MEILLLLCLHRCWLATTSQLTDFRVKVNLRLAVYHQISLGAKPLETHNQSLFFQLNPCSHSLCNILSDEEIGLSLMNMLGLYSSVCIAHTACHWKFFLVHYIQVVCQYRLCKADHAYLTYLMVQRQLSYLNNRKLDHQQVWASYILTDLPPSCSLYSLSMDHTENTVSYSSSAAACISIATDTFFKPLPSIGHLFWLCYSMFQLSRHNI
jgi:hypothetical protein